MTAKVLCEVHNNALSILDCEAARFFSTLREFDQDLRDTAESTSADTHIDGAQVERWMLKLLAGLVYGRLIDAAVLWRGAPWLDILFGREEWPEGWGFYMVASGETLYSFDGVEVEPKTMNDEVWAAVIGVAGMKFYLALGTPERNSSYLRRPAAIIMKRLDRRAVKRLIFDWPSGPGTGPIELNRVSQYDGPRPQDRGYRER